ncbi:hypothetical protein [Chryseobacterium camelliae]|uniref:hypothetical protein n=1 Tax=Chryseobacterium camelliae TaxID=1265445 RepID=UPI0012FE3FAA|nr:hypothetical protein [Chryseobacterium camelliae]
MITKILIFLNLIVFCYFNSQLKMECNINFIDKKATVILLNTTNNNVVIPIDKHSLRPYFNDICLDLSQYQFDYPVLGPSILIHKNDSILESSSSGDIGNDLAIIENESKKRKANINKYENDIRLWQKLHHIKSFEEAKINYYVYNNLMFLKPKEKIVLEFYFDLNNITKEKYMNYFYRLESGQNYSLNISLKINECIYNYLTGYQKSKLKKYKLFYGTIVSNKIELK